MKITIGRDTTLCMSLAARPGTFGSRFHNWLYQELDLDFVYKAFTTTDLSAAIGGIRALSIRGCAISMPFKEVVIPMLDRLQPSAQVINSVNTIVNDAGKLVGHNTDYSAARRLIEDCDVPRNHSVLIRGSGGMAKAVVAAIRDAGFTSGTIVARNEQTGRALASLYGFEWRSELPVEGAPILVNVTPLGMTGPDADALAFPEAVIANCIVAFDAVALPSSTPFLQCATSYGKMTIDGAQVATHQALAQFSLYTGITPSADQVARAASFARGEHGHDSNPGKIG